MHHENVVEQVGGGYVLCIGMPLQRVGEVARLLRGRAAVIATADADGARTLLGESPAAVLPDVEAPRALEVRARAPGVLADDAPVRVEPPRRIVLGPLMVDPAAREVTVRGAPVHLSMREFDLLVALASAPERVWSFAELTRTVWRTGYLGDPDPVVSAVKRLRKRLRVLPELRVSSVRGIGYRLLVPR